VPRKRKFKQLQVRRSKRGGSFRWLMMLAVMGAAGFLWWRHAQPQKINVRPPASAAKTPVPVKTPPKPLVIARQSPADFPRPARDILEAQVALARRAISSGSIDGAIGSQTRLAISVFQRTEKLPETGRLDTNTRPQLTLDSAILTTYAVTTNDLAHLQPLGKTWLAKSQQTALDFETALELVAENAHSHPSLIRQLNPGVNWTNLAAGTVLKIPEVNYPEPADKAAFLIIHLSEKFLEAFDAQTNLLVHFPCSIAAHVEKRPVGELHVAVVAPRPNYTFDPAVFPESPEAQAIGHKLILPPGPNNPVGVAWIGLDKTGYGIHGTPAPEQVGRTESHGCFRLANWDAEYLLKLAWVGLPVEVEP
jgi:lipoprotein-anchoring transpeptidase ErfK/SrfK